MKLNQTKTSIDVMSCCVETVAIDKEDVEIGDKDSCKICHQVFTLIEDGDINIWKPDWQLTQ